MLPESFIQELKYKNDIETVVGRYVQLKRRGRNVIGLCPFHNEKTPSFTLFPEDQSFYCFGCGAGGDVISFIKRMEHLDGMEAIRFLAEKAGMTVPESGADNRQTQLRKRILEANREAALFFHQNLMSDAGKEARAYLVNRGLTKNTVVHFGLGYASNDWNQLGNALKRKGFTTEELVEADLLKQNEKGHTYDSFMDRVIFPIMDLRGNVVGFSGRMLHDRGPKYYNTRDNPVYKKGNLLFALNFAKNTTKKEIILCEGNMDVVSLHQSGFDNTVAACGTAFTPEQARLLAQYTSMVLLSYDSDGAGQKATQRTTPILDSVGLKVKVLSIPDAKDPDEFIKKYGAERFQKLIESSYGFTEYQIKKLRDALDLETSEGKVDYLKQFVKLMAKVTNPLERDVYIGAAALELNVSKSTIAGQVDKELNRERKSAEKQQEQQLVRGISDPKYSREEAVLRSQHPQEVRAEERLLQYLIKNQDAIPKIMSKCPLDCYISPIAKSIAKLMYECCEEGQEFSVSQASQQLSDEAVSRITGWKIGAGPMVTREEADDCVKVLLRGESKKSKEDIASMGEDELRRYVANIKKSKP